MKFYNNTQTSAIRFVEPVYILKRIFILIFVSTLYLAPNDVYSQFFEKEDSFIEKSGDASVMLLPVSSLATSIISEYNKGTWQFTKSFLLNLAVTGAGKVLINKQRPLQGGDYAFPSGHPL